MSADTVNVPRGQLVTLCQSLALNSLLPGEGETLINCWIKAHDAASPSVGGWERTDIQRMMDPVRAYLWNMGIKQRIAEEASERAVDAMYRALNAPPPVGGEGRHRSHLLAHPPSDGEGVMSKPDLRKERPVRFFIAMTVYRLIWWPIVAVHVPFALVGMFVDWLSETALPAVGNFTAPAFDAARNFAVAVGNAVLGFKPEKLATTPPANGEG